MKKEALLALALLWVSLPSISETIDEKIKAFAREEHPDDYSMQEYAFEQQTDAYKFIQSAGNDEIKEIAVAEYPDDYSMQRYVYEQQLVVRAISFETSLWLARPQRLSSRPSASI